MNNIPTIISASDLRQIVPGVDATIDENTIRPYLREAHKAVSSMIGREVFAAIAESQKDSQLYIDLQTAVANRLMYDYKLFETIQKRQVQQIDTYKYELESMLVAYQNFYFDALDSVIHGLNASNNPIQAWEQAPARKMLSELLIQSTSEFNELYGIDNSDFFFFLTMPLQRKVIDKHLAGIPLDNLPEGMVRRIKTVTATFTVAYALRQFDITMLPRSLRNPGVDGAYRHASSEQNTMYDLSEFLFGEAEQELARIMAELNAPEPGSDIESTNNLNKPDNKFFLFS